MVQSLVTEGVWFVFTVHMLVKGAEFPLGKDMGWFPRWGLDDPDPEGGRKYQWLTVQILSSWNVRKLKGYTQ